ncbi:MAG: hypothetical protein ACM3S5_04195 [Rhodospirillales bacterium]
MGGAAAVLFAVLAVQTVLLDRIAATADSEVITLGQVLDEIRIAAFLNREAPDFSPSSKRRAAERLVDQALIRREMRISRFSEPAPGEAEKMLADIKRQRFPTEEAFQKALEEYGITESYLLAYLNRQLATLRFTDYRFHPLANGGQTGSQAAVVDEQMEAWLKQARASAQIRFFEEAFR